MNTTNNTSTPSASPPQQQQQQPTASTSSPHKWGSAYFSVFLENNFVLYHSNRTPDGKREARFLPEDEVPQARLHQLAFGIAFGAVTDGTLDTHGPPWQATVEAVVSSGAAGGASSSGGTPVSAKSSLTTSTTTGGGFDASPKKILKFYRITLTCGFGVNTAFSQDTMALKQAAVAVVIHVRRGEELMLLLQFPALLRYVLNIAADAAVKITTHFFERYMQSAPTKQVTTELEHSLVGQQAYTYIVEHLTHAFSTSTSSVSACAVPSLSARVMLNADSITSIVVHKAQPRHWLLGLSLASFEQHAERCSPASPRRGLTATTASPGVNRQISSAGGHSPSPNPKSIVGGETTTGSPTTSPSVGTTSVAVTDVLQLFHDAIKDMTDYSVDFLSSVIAGLLSVNNSFVEDARPSASPLSGGHHHRHHQRDGYEDYWAQEAQIHAAALDEVRNKRQKSITTGIFRKTDGGESGPPSLGGGVLLANDGHDDGRSEDGADRSTVASLSTSPAAPHALSTATGGAQQHVHAQSYQLGGPWMYGESKPPHTAGGGVNTTVVEHSSAAEAAAASLTSPALAHSAPLNASSLAAAAAAAAMTEEGQDHHDATAHETTAVPLHGSIHCGQSTRSEGRVVLFTTDAALARKLLIIAAFFYRPPASVAEEHDAYCADTSTNLGELISRQLSINGSQHRPSSSDGTVGGVGLSQSTMSLSAAAVEEILLRYPAAIASAVSSVRLASLPVVWVAEEFNPKVHVELLNDRLAVETTVLVIAPRLQQVRRLSLAKRCSFRNILVERRATGVVKTFPFGGTSTVGGGCFSSWIAADVAMVPNLFLKKQLQRAMAAEQRSKRAVHAAVYMEEVIELVAHQSRVYRMLHERGRFLWRDAETVLSAGGVGGGAAADVAAMAARAGITGITSSSRQPQYLTGGVKSTRDVETLSQRSSSRVSSVQGGGGRSATPNPTSGTGNGISSTNTTTAGGGGGAGGLRSGGAAAASAAKTPTTSWAVMDPLNMFNMEFQEAMACDGVDATHVQLLSMLIDTHPL